MKKSALLILVMMLSLVSCNFFKSSNNLELIPFLQKDKYGYFDLEGKIAINPQFDYATAFRDGLALVKLSGENGKWGYIDKSGKFVINAIYKDATVFKDGLAWVISDNSAPSAIEKNGNIIFTLKEANEVRLFSDGLAAFSIADDVNYMSWGFVDKTGNQIINAQFDEVGDFTEGKCAVKNKDGKWGYIDKSGKIIINYQFDEAAPFKGEKAIVTIDNKAGVIDSEGKYIINPQFSTAKNDGEMFLISQEDKVGWCDNAGKYIINPQFDNAYPFKENKLACIVSGGKYGYIDKTGKIIINPQFDFASPFIGKFAIVSLGDKFGLIDEEGKYKVNPQFESIAPDLFSYLNDTSLKQSIFTDFLDVNTILSVINVNNPENISFNDGFQTVIKKLNKTSDDFIAYENDHMIYNSKKINSEVDYSLSITGNIKAMNDDTYEYYITNEKVQSFNYQFNLAGKAYGKAESVQKAFENKLTGFNIVKKGYVEGRYASIYKGPNSYVITWNTGESSPVFYICNKNFDISNFLSLIVADKESSIMQESYEETPYEQVAVDTMAVMDAEVE
jgi:hypothetical protein